MDLSDRSRARGGHHVSKRAVAGCSALAFAFPTRVERAVSLTFRVEPVHPATADAYGSERLLDLLRQRIDGEVALAQEEPDVVSVTIPLSSLPHSTALTELSAHGMTLQLAPDAQGLDEHGGLVLIDEEVLRYRRREGAQLEGCERGAFGTRAAQHAADATVRAIDSGLLRRIESVGQVRFLIEAADDDFRAAGTDLVRERRKLDGWLARSEDPAAFNRLRFEEGGPPPGIGWLPLRTDAEHRFPLVLAQQSEWTFGTDDLERVEPSMDELGYPAVRFQMREERRSAFGDFTGAHVNEGLGIVLDGAIVTLATINSSLPGEGIIPGGNRGFDADEVADLIAILSHGPLPGRPELVGVRVR